MRRGVSMGGVGGGTLAHLWDQCQNLACPEVWLGGRGMEGASWPQRSSLGLLPVGQVYLVGWLRLSAVSTSK